MGTVNNNKGLQMEEGKKIRVSASTLKKLKFIKVDKDFYSINEVLEFLLTKNENVLESLAIKYMIDLYSSKNTVGLNDLIATLDGSGIDGAKMLDDVKKAFENRK